MHFIWTICASVASCGKIDLETVFLHSAPEGREEPEEGSPHEGTQTDRSLVFVAG